MNRYQLAKLVQWAGTLESRKRMQKVVFMLQAAGCPFEADYFLHQYGPYSEDVARLTDEMVQLELLDEREERVGGNAKYSYSMSPKAVSQLQEHESTDAGRQQAQDLVKFEAKAREFLAADLRQLEYASTIVFFQKQTGDWTSALKSARRIKGDGVDAALALAQSAVT